MLVPAPALGLLPNDNLNALKCTLVEVDFFPEALVRIMVNEALVELHGLVIMHVSVGHNGEAAVPFGEFGENDFVEGEIVEMQLMGETPLGPIDVRVRDHQKFPFQPSRVFIEEQENNTPGILDLPPFTPQGTAESFFDVFLEVEVAGQVLHHRQPIQMQGIVKRKPAARGDTLRSSSTVDLFTEDGQPSGVQLSNALFTPDALPPGARIGRGGIVSGAGFGQGAAVGSIMSLFGENLADSRQSALTTPLPTSLAGTTVTLFGSTASAATAALSSGAPAQAGSLAPLFFVSPTQINFLIPSATALGPATLTVTRADGSSSTATIEIEAIAPALFSANASGQGVAAAFFLRVAADGSRTQGLIYDLNSLVPVPIDLSPPGDQVFLLLFGTGIRGFTSTVTATVGGETVPVLFAGEQPIFVGLDQVNIGPLPLSLIGRGEVDIVLTADSIQTNTVTVTIP